MSKCDGELSKLSASNVATKMHAHMRQRKQNGSEVTRVNDI